MAEQIVIGTETFKRRHPLAVWLGLPIITLGIYHFVWHYKVNDEARRYLRDPTIRPAISVLALLLGWILIVPPFVSIYRTGGRVRRMQANAGIPDRCEPWIALILAFIFGLHSLYLQSQLNRIWDAYSRPGLLPQAYPSSPPSQAVQPPAVPLAPPPSP